MCALVTGVQTVALPIYEDPMPRRLPLYVHVPFCVSPCFYCGCNRIITRDHGRGATYLHRLAREITLVAPLFDRDRDVIQLHLGGGTPNFLSPELIGAQIGRAHVCTPVTNAHIVCRMLLEKHNTPIT